VLDDRDLLQCRDGGRAAEGESGDEAIHLAGKPLFARARKKLGVLAAGEMYGFVPALALGGTASVATLEKVAIIEHLDILAQLGPLRIFENPLLKPGGP
jgi:hypothetical protein